MTRSRDPFAIALDHIRRRALAGAYRPGQPVVIVDEARRLALSTTPVREALAWLCGEGVIERSPSGGFLAPRLDPGAIRDRYAFRLLCLEASLDRLEALMAGGAQAELAAAPPADLAAQMDWWVRSTGNQVLADAFERVGRLLVQFASAERRLFADRDEEASKILALWPSDGIRLRQALLEYHRRRMEAAPLLALEVATQSGAEPGEGG